MHPCQTVATAGLLVATWSNVAGLHCQNMECWILGSSVAWLIFKPWSFLQTLPQLHILVIVDCPLSKVIIIRSVPLGTSPRPSRAPLGVFLCGTIYSLLGFFLMEAQGWAATHSCPGCCLSVPSLSLQLSPNYPWGKCRYLVEIRPDKCNWHIMQGLSTWKCGCNYFSCLTFEPEYSSGLLSEFVVFQAITNVTFQLYREVVAISILDPLINSLAYFITLL